LRRNPSHLLQTEQRGVQGTLVQLQRVPADLLDPAGDSPPMLGTESVEGTQYHEGQGAVQYVRFVLRHRGLPFGSLQEYTTGSGSASTSCFSPVHFSHVMDAHG